MATESTRELKANAAYFPHAVGFRNKKEVKYILQTMGPLYHSIFINLLEVICESPTLSITISEVEVKLYVNDFKASKEDIEKVILEGKAIGAFNIFHEVEGEKMKFGEYQLYSPFLEELLEPLLEKRESARANLKNWRKKKSQKAKNTDENTEKQESLPAPILSEKEQKMMDWVNKYAPRIMKMQKPLTIHELLDIQERYPSQEFVQQMLIAMHNYKKLLSNNVSAHYTFMNWAKREWPNFKPSK